MSGNEYCTRFGIMAADKMAHTLRERAGNRLFFLKEILAAFEQGDDQKLSNFALAGLGVILEDIHSDIDTCFDYYTGDDPTPGKE